MNKIAVLYLMLWLLVGCAGGTSGANGEAEGATEVANPPSLPDLGQAPELRNDTWLNTRGENLRLADLRGRVALLEFWTFG